MKEHGVTIVSGGQGSLCLANRWQKAGAGVANPETSLSELMARVERQYEIIGDLLAKNEQLRNRLRRIEHSTQSNPAQLIALQARREGS
jgi:hypothetical protein